MLTSPPASAGAASALQALVAMLVCSLSVLLSKAYVARRKVNALRRLNLPMPPFHALAGHFLALRAALLDLPSNCTTHVAFERLSRAFPSGLFYLDLWPFASPILVVGTPEVAQQVQDHEAALDKPDEIRGPLDTITGGRSLLTMRDQAWRMWRGLFNPGFSSGYMLGLAPRVAEEVAVFVELMRERARVGEIFLLEEDTLKLTFDVIGVVVLDTRLGCQRSSNALATALRRQIEWTTFGTILNPFKRYFSIRPLMQWFNSWRMDRYIRAELDKRFLELKTNSGADQSKSVISLALRAFLQDKFETSLSIDKEFEEFKNAATPQLRLFLFAGHDTTSSTLIYCYHMLSRHPAVLSQLRDEHERVFGSEIWQTESIIKEDAARLNDLPLTLAVIKETLRLHPPASAMRQGHDSVHLVDLDGKRYPTAGCNVWVLTNVLHQNPKHWPDARQFIPERWLVGPDHPLYPAKGAWRPFMFGPRSCIGQTLAILELKVALVMTVREFDILPAYEEWDALHPRQGVKAVEGERAYPAEKGGGGAHPADAYPCRVSRRASRD